MSDQQAQELTGENAAIEAVARRLYLILPGHDRLFEWDDMGRTSKKPWRDIAIEIRALWNVLAARASVQVERPDERTANEAIDAAFAARAAARLPERPDEGITDAMVEAAYELLSVREPERDDVRKALSAALAARPVSSEENP